MSTELSATVPEKQSSSDPLWGNTILHCIAWVVVAGNMVLIKGSYRDGKITHTHASHITSRMHLCLYRQYPGVG